MAPSDVAGVFSRYFIVGFFLPAFFSLVALSLALTDSFLPSVYRDLSSGGQIAALGGTGLLLGLILLGLNWQVFRLYEGYPLFERRGRRPLSWVYALMIARRKATLERLQHTRDESSDSGAASTAAWKLDREFPVSAERLLPTGFGNAVLAFETHAMKRWGLDSVAVWPRIDMLLSERESELQANSRSEAAFFVNTSLLLVAAGLLLIVDQLVAEPLCGLALLVYFAPFLLAVLMAHWAVGAATRWGNTVRSAIDLHRFGLYEKLGVRMPTSFSDERDGVAARVNQLFLYGTAIPDEYFNAPSPDDKEEK
jgi:hypothetical protein